MSITIVGKNSTIAKRLAQRLPDKIRWISSHPEPDDLYLDLLEADRFNYDRIQEGDFILVLAAISSPDFCEKNYDTAYQINVTGTAAFIQGCLERGAKVIFTSSDTVYGDIDGIANEQTDCSPLGEYGKMKFKIEQQFADCANFKVCRLSYVFAKTDKFTAYLHQCAVSSKIANIFHPLYRNVVYIEDLIDVILKLISSWNDVQFNTLNVCGSESISRIDLANLYKKNINTMFEFVQEYPGDKFFQARPQSIQVASLYLEKLLGRKPHTIEQAMKLEFGTRT